MIRKYFFLPTFFFLFVLRSIKQYFFYFSRKAAEWNSGKKTFFDSLLMQSDLSLLELVEMESLDYQVLHWNMTESSRESFLFPLDAVFQLKKEHK